MICDARSLYACAFMICLCMAGCEEDLAVREHFARPFSMYGVLSPDLPFQSIRLYVIEDFPTLNSNEEPAVDVFSTDLGTGDRLAWRDSVVVDPFGQREYTYLASFRAEFGHTYRIEALRRSDGARSYADVRVPQRVNVRILSYEDASNVEVLIEGDSIRALKPEVEYDVFKPGAPILRYSFSYQGTERPTAEGWIVEIRMVGDASEIIFLYNAEAGTRGGGCRVDFVHLYRLSLNVLVGDRLWDPPGGVFNPDVLSEPTALSNVNNGFGFIGAGYRIEEELMPSKEAVSYACFIDALQRGPTH